MGVEAVGVVKEVKNGHQSNLVRSRFACDFPSTETVIDYELLRHDPN